MKEKKVYLDTNILSRIPNLDVSEGIENDLDALTRLVELDGINFVTSFKTKEEILKTPNKIKNYALRIVYGIMKKIPMHTVHISHGGAIGASAIGEDAIGGGGWIEIDPLYDELNAIFDDDDAEHIFQAIRAGCDYFITFDKKTILNRASKSQNEVQKICGMMRLVSPEDAILLIQKDKTTS
jgi:predicted nucleic acid-binding protein